MGAPEDHENLVGDEWSKLKAYCAIVGSDQFGTVSPDKMQEHITTMLSLDAEHNAKVRARVTDVVKDKEVAAALTPWYPSWCKRPTFSDVYLDTFNQEHVHLVDTNGKGVESATPKGIVANGEEYPIDILILSTGYRSPGVGAGNPAVRTGIDIAGRGGHSMAGMLCYVLFRLDQVFLLVFLISQSLKSTQPSLSREPSSINTTSGAHARLKDYMLIPVCQQEKWTSLGPTSLHGCTTNGFPNLFWMGPSQVGATPNFAHVLDVLSTHVAHVIKAGYDRVGGTEKEGVTIEASAKAEEIWSMRVAQGAAFLGSVLVCTPGYMTNEGEAMQMSQAPEEMIKSAKGGPWPGGMIKYIRELETWRADGSLQGIEVSVA